MKKGFNFFILFNLLFAGQCLATHIVGGEMYYLYQGNNQYQVTLRVYRDCINGQPDFDNPARIDIYDGNNNFFDSTRVMISARGSIPNAINSPCLDPPLTICYEYAEYHKTIYLPPNSGSYTIAYQRCCRNFSIINIPNSLNTGATYMAQITDPSVEPVNSNPVFTKLPPNFICRNATFTFDHSATDTDGDSLVYELCDPYGAGNTAFPVPWPFTPPPFTPISFLSPYTFQDPLGTGLTHIDSHSGVLTMTPSQDGQYVYGIAVKEYRNGIYLGESRRDFQVNVINCPKITVASILSPTIACGDLTADFVNSSYNAAGYKWDFGDLNTFSDTSILKDPPYTYPDTGDYWATLIAYSPDTSICNDTMRGLVHIYPVFLTRYYLTNYHCSSIFSFYDQSFGLHGHANYWFWNFGDNSVSSDSAPVHQYSAPGDYLVSLITSADSACTDTMTRVVHVLRNPVSNFTLNLDTCTYTITTKNNSQFESSSRWDFGDYWNSFDNEGTHQFASSGDYDVQLIVSTDSVCEDTLRIHISIPKLAEPDFTYKVPPCDSLVSFTNYSRNAIKYIWDFGDGDTSHLDSPDHTYSISGIIPVTLTAYSAQGCSTDISSNINFVSRKESEFDAALDSCSGLVSFYDVTYGAASYYWKFGDGATSTENIPKHNYEKDGTYYVELMVNSESICADSIAKYVSNEEPLGEKVFIPNSFTPNGDGHNDLFHPSIFRPCEIYKLTIYNRWGQVVFETEDASEVYWDGKYKGEPMPNDLYVYILEGLEKKVNGFINIQR